MNHKDSQITAANCLYDIIKEDTLRIKYLLGEVRYDYNNPAFDYLLRHCKSVAELENFLKNHSHMFIVENGRVARQSDELESGQLNADKYFEEKLEQYSGPVDVLSLRKHIDEAPPDIKNFIDRFYPENYFKRFFQKNPHLFATHKDNNTVYLVERESVDFFRQTLEHYGDGIRFSSLRGRVNLAPEHVRTYVNNRYPDTEILGFLEKYKKVFQLDRHGFVYLVT